MTSHNRRVKAVKDVRDLIVCMTSGQHHEISGRQAKAVAAGFKKVLFSYLDGIGHVRGLEAPYVTQTEYQEHAANPLFRANMILQQMTDSLLLPIGNPDQGQMKVGRSPFNLQTMSDVAPQVILDLTQFSEDIGDLPMAISTCTRSATVKYNRWLHQLVVAALHGQSEGFNRWIHPQLTPSTIGDEYNCL
jgi:hypothetical protein